MKDKALKLALEALEGQQPENPFSVESKAITAIKQALADSALDRMAENARELGLDYEPVQEPVVTKTEKGIVLHTGWDDLPAGTKLYAAAQPAPTVQESVACLSESQAKAILDLALDLEKTGRIVVLTEGQERADFVARNRNIQCALEDALRNATTTPAEQPAPYVASQLVQEPVAWMFEFPDKRVKPKFDSAPHGGNWQPLYIHPQPDAYGYAKRLSEAIWKKHYQSTAPQWEPFDDLMGVLTQIDNMTSGLITPPAAPVIDKSTAIRIATALGWTPPNVATPLDETSSLAAPTPEERKRQSARSAWVGLTDEEISACDPSEECWGLHEAVRRAETKLKEKNTP
jgi:hypothetical protein